jgi:protein ImuB
VRGAHVFDAAQTLKRAHQVSLERLGMRAKTRDGLERLGLECLGDLARFGVDALRMRYGEEAARWCRVAQGYEVWPLCAEPHVQALRVALPIEPPDTDVTRLCFLLEGGLRVLFEQLVSRGESAGTLWLTLKLERGGTHQERLEPARATREAPLWIELLRLRLASVSLGAPVEEVVLEVEGVAAQPGQERLFPSGRDLAAGDRALARVRAMFGEQSVRRARLCEGHLPEAKFRWDLMPQLESPVPGVPGDHLLPLVRRLRRPERFTAESPLAKMPVHDDTGRVTGVLVRGGERLSLTGPYRLSGGWWVREVARDYYYAETPSGALFWVFYDHARAGWFEHAQVE